MLPVPSTLECLVGRVTGGGGGAGKAGGAIALPRAVRMVVGGGWSPGCGVGSKGPPALTQFPGQITVSRSDFVWLLPVEIAGWFLRRTPADALRPWVLVLSPDEKGRLAAGLLSRGPFAPCNVTFGITTLRGGDDEKAQMDAIALEGVYPMITETDGLVPITWNRAIPSACVRHWYITTPAVSHAAPASG